MGVRERCALHPVQEQLWPPHHRWLAGRLVQRQPRPGHGSEHCKWSRGPQEVRVGCESEVMFIRKLIWGSPKETEARETSRLGSPQ